MKKISYFFVVLVLLTGCAKGQNKEDLIKLRDSLDNMVLRGSLRNDTTMLERALKLSDFLLSIDTTDIGKRLCYRHRSIIFYVSSG